MGQIMNKNSSIVLILTSLIAFFWVNLYIYGLFLTIMFTIIIASVIGIYLKLNGKI